MRKLIAAGLLLLSLLSLSSVVWAAAYPFKIKHVELQGLRHIHASTVMHYLPVHVGEVLTQAQSNTVLATLYQTGFFSDVSLSRHHNTLIVTLAELPAIGHISFEGNDAIPKKQMVSIQQKSHLVLGKVFNQATLKAVVESLTGEYKSLGYYNAQVNAHVAKLPDNMVSIEVRIKEGQVALVKQLHIIGQHDYSEAHLLHLCALSTPNILSFITHSDHYSTQKLTQCVTTIKQSYLNSGYLRFAVLSQHAKFSDNHHSVSVTIHISEGRQFHFSAFHLTGAGQAGKDHFNPIFQGQKTSLFSRKVVMSNEQSIMAFLGNQGYAFAAVSVVPSINMLHHTVAITYHVNKGSRYYVRHIYLQGNTRTSGLVLRKMMRQMEGGVYNKGQVDESKRRLANQPYLRSVYVTSHQVSGERNQLDLTYHVKDVSAGRASLMGGYSDVYGLLYGASISQANFLGTGRSVSVGFQRSAYSNNYYFNYNNPYYTIYGTSRGFNFFYTKTMPGAVNLSTYTQDTLGGSVTYGIPITEYDTLSFGYGYDYNRFTTSSTDTPLEIVNYLKNAETNKFFEIPLTASWRYSNLNKYPLPTSGVTQSVTASLNLPAEKKSISFYKLTYSGQWYMPIAKQYIVEAHTNLGYGDSFNTKDPYPFFENFYAGGISTVPGFTGNTLGPRVGKTYCTKSGCTNEPSGAVGTAMGGNIQMVGGVGLIFPNHISDNLRTQLLVSGGNVFSKRLNLDGLRYSAGLLLTWYSPVGPLDFSFALPINAKASDQLSFFQFSMGAVF